MKHFGKGILVICLALLSGFVAQSQDNGNYEYSREYIWGINKNTNSGLIGGIVLKYSHAMDDKRFQTYGIELINVKHPMESRYISNFGNPFIWAKSNYLYAIRFQYGRDYLVFKKAPQQGVQINASWALGPTLGVVAPYYIKYELPGSSGSAYAVVPFDPALHTRGGVMGTGRLFQGLGESKIQPGVNAKAAINFEFGTFKSNVTGFEVGVLMEAYNKEVVIIPTAANRSFFTSAFFTLYYGTRR